MNTDTTAPRALSHLHALGLLTDAEHAQALAHPELQGTALRTPAEALGWAAAKGIVAPEALPGLRSRAVPGAGEEAHRIVADAVAMVSGQAPAWVLFEIGLMANRLEEGVTDAALDRLLALRLIEPVQFDQARALLPEQDPAWAAPASPAATLAWAVRTGVLTLAQLQALASPTSALAAGSPGSPGLAESQESPASEQARQVAGEALAVLAPDGVEGRTKTVRSRTVTWHRTGASGNPRGAGLIAIAVVAAIALYLLFGR